MLYKFQFIYVDQTVKKSKVGEIALNSYLFKGPRLVGYKENGGQDNIKIEKISENDSMEVLTKTLE